MYRYGMDMSPMLNSRVAISGLSCGANFNCVQGTMNDSGAGCGFCVICHLSAVIGVLSRPPSCSALSRAARKSSTGCSEATQGGFDFFWNKRGILLMEEVKGVNGKVDQHKLYPEPLALMSVVGLRKKQDFLIENAVQGAASTLPFCF